MKLTSRKVRIFRDPKKSPNWYVEWRIDGRRRCRSVGKYRRDAIAFRARVLKDMQRAFGGSHKFVSACTPIDRDQIAKELAILAETLQQCVDYLHKLVARIGEGDPAPP